jgi:alkanesulfonate monooxygenase SsuD/methylene tetrahydromethanopterin reductase-like flavin-dependent oxidoreductase (luciferase family)
MKFGISLSGMAQQPMGADMGRRFNEIVEYVRMARKLGFDLVYQGQHYLTHPYQQFQAMPLLARLAAEAEGMRIVATLLIPTHHPVDLAERVATMDVITGGRFVVSAALGYRDEEYRAFGVDRRRRVARFMECLEVMVRLWTEEEVSFHGRHFQLEGARSVLKPLQRPHPPIWVAANSEAAIRRAGKHGYTWYINPHATYATIEGQIAVYREAGRASGAPLPAGLPIGREVYLHEDARQARLEAQPFLGGKYEAYAHWGQDRALPGSESFDRSFEELARDRFIVGTPEECVADLERYRSLGVDCAILRMIWPGMDLKAGLRSMRLFAQRVMPRFS